MEKPSPRSAASGTATGPVRGPRALELRREGIDYDALRQPLAATGVEPGDRAYGTVRSTYIRPGYPGIVLRPVDVDGSAALVALQRSV